MPHPHRPSALPGLALAALLLTPSVAGADVTRFDRSADVGAVSLQDGVFDTPPGFQEDGFSSFDRTETSQIGAERAVASTRATVVQGLDSASATASGSIEVQHGTVDEGRAAGGGSGASFLICVDERSTFTLRVQGNVEANAEDSTLVRADFCCDASGAPATLEAGDGSLPRSAILSRSGVIPDTQGEDCVSVVVRADSNLGNGGPDTNLPTSRVTWSLSLNVATSPQAPEASEAFLWVAGSSGAFGNPQSWDPLGPATEGVPTFLDGVRSDAALVNAPFSVTMDLAGAAAASQSRATLSRGVGVQRAGRLAVDRTDPLRPINGGLFLDNLDLDIQGLAQSRDGRSLEVGNGATLNLDQGTVQARHVAIGSDGDGTLTVQGPDGGFTTLGRFGLGADGDGNVDITNGATVVTAETVLGEVDGQGSARIAGPGSQWFTGNLAVGLADDATLTIEAGAGVESEADEDAVVDFGLSGDERASAVVKGKGGSGTPSSWKVGHDLLIGGRGKVEVREGGALSARVVQVGTGGNEADCLLGQACLDVDDGTVTTVDGMAVGLATGAGKLRIGPGGRVSTPSGILMGVFFDSLGEVTVLGPSAADQISVGSIGLGDIVEESDAIGSRGELVLQNGAKVASSGNVNVGTFGESLSGVIELRGDAADPDATRLRVAGIASELSVGAVSAEPAEQLVAATGEILLANGLIELVDANLEIRRRGRVSGLGRVDGVGLSFVTNDGVIGCGVEIDANYLQGQQGTLECPQATLPGAPQLNPLAATAFARALRARPVPPPAPPSGPFVVTGDATLDGLLVLQFLNGFAPRAGDSFDLIEVAGAVSGGFANVLVRGLAPGAEPAQDLVAGKLSLTFPEARVALPTVSLKAKPSLKETKKKGGKVKVARSGDTSAPLLVAYTIGGTATNEIDYGPLAGTIEIPAGKRSAKIVVRPRADALVEGPETIELELVPGDDYAPSLFSRVAIELKEGKR